MFDEEISCDKTFAEILAAYQAGRPCYAKCRMNGKVSWGYLYLPLTELDENASSGYARFAMAQMTDGSSPEKLETNYVKIGADGTAVGYFGTQDLGSAQMLPEVDPSDEGKFLRVNSDAEFVAETVPAFTGASTSAAGAMGFVPAPAKGQQNKWLKGDGTWGDLPSASTGAKGITYLVDEVTRTDTDKAATARAVNTIYKMFNRSTGVHEADANYTTLMARGMSLNAAETTPAVNGSIAWQYE